MMEVLLFRCCTVHSKNKLLVSIFYDIIILSTGSRSKLFNTMNVKRSIFKDYKQTAVTSILNHDYKINGASQYFLKEGPLAILPFGKKMFSIVWSLDNKFYEEKKSSISTDFLDFQAPRDIPGWPAPQILKVSNLF